MLPSQALAAAMIRHALPGVSTAGANAVLGASWQLSMQVAAALQHGASTYSSTGISSSAHTHLDAPNSIGSPGTNPAHSPIAGQRQMTSQAASRSQQSSTQQAQSSAAEAEEPIEMIRARVFEQHVGNNKRSGRRPLLKALRGDWIADWYFLPDPNLPLVENFNEADRLERVGLRKAAGKAPPKKGQGKRAGGKKR